MGFKKTTRSLDFADLASGQLPGTKPLHQAHRAAQRHHQLVSEEVARAAYPPLMLFKCLLLQKWFRIQSDTELEDQINDRLSFKSFLGLSFSQPAAESG